MSEDQNKKEVTVLYRNLTPEIASDIIKLHLSEEAEKTQYGYLTSGANYTGHWWTELWVDKTHDEEWLRNASRKISAFKAHPKEATEVYINKDFCELWGTIPSPEQMIAQAEDDLKRYKYYLDNIDEIIAEIERKHLEPWRIEPDNPY